MRIEAQYFNITLRVNPNEPQSPVGHYHLVSHSCCCLCVSHPPHNDIKMKNYMYTPPTIFVYLAPKPRHRLWISFKVNHLAILCNNIPTNSCWRAWALSLHGMLQSCKLTELRIGISTSSRVSILSWTAYLSIPLACFVIMMHSCNEREMQCTCTYWNH